MSCACTTCHVIVREGFNSLNELADAFQKPADYYVIKMLGEGRPVVLERAAVDAARERIQTRYKVRAAENLRETAKN